MIAACGAAIAAPFQVFLWAGAILGPTHYLTEISWLHDHNYFTKLNLARRWWLGLVAFAVLTIGFAYTANDPMQRTIPVPFLVALIYLVFAAAAAAIFVRDWLNAVDLFLILSLGLFYFSSFQNYTVAANLPITIVHVFFFTGAFILLGALTLRHSERSCAATLYQLSVFESETVAAHWTSARRVSSCRRGRDAFDCIRVSLTIA
jgi:hypothetical protein